MSTPPRSSALGHQNVIPQCDPRSPSFVFVFLIRFVFRLKNNETADENAEGRMPSLDGSDRAAPPSLDRSDCSSIRDMADFDVLTPRSECVYEDIEAEADGDITPRVGVAPHFTLQPYLKSYLLHSHIKAALLAKAHVRRGEKGLKRPVSAPAHASGRRDQQDMIVINGMCYVPAGPLAVPSNIDLLRRQNALAMPVLKMSRHFTDFSSPSKGPLELESPERKQNRIRTRPWTANPRTKTWTDSERAFSKLQERDTATLEATISRAQSAGADRWHETRTNSASQPEHSCPADSSNAPDQSTQASTSPTTSVRKRPNSAGFIQPCSSPSHDRRRPSSAHPTSGGRRKCQDELSHSVGNQVEVESPKRPSSAGFLQPRAGVGIFRPPHHGRPASANRIRFQGDVIYQGPAHPAHHPALGPVQHDLRGRGNRPPSGASARPSSSASHFSSRPSSASAQRQLQHETEKITRYSQDPIHPERLQVTHVTRNRQSEDSRMNLQYEEIFEDEGEAVGEDEAWGVAREARLSSQPPSGASRLSSGASARPSSALSRPISASNQIGSESWRSRPGTQQSVKGWPSSQGHAESHHSSLPSDKEYGEPYLPPGYESQRRGTVRRDAVQQARPRPSTAPGRQGKATTAPWQHRMERIWEKRFSYLGEGDVSQNSADSSGGSECSRSHTSPRSDASARVKRVRPRSASGVLVSGAGEMSQLRRQIRVMEDVQRDLDVRMTSAYTGISEDDEWLRQAQQRTSPSSTCVVQ